MKNHFDVIVIGVGSMGSSACWHLASRGCNVLGLEQFDVVHEKGSHTGQSRIIRKAYFEHPDYVPLLERAYQNWKEFEAITTKSLYHKTGILYIGNPETETISGTRKSATLYNIPLEDWDIEKARERFPMFEIPSGFDVFIEPNAGFLTPERAIRLYTDEAVKQGASIKSNVKVTHWSKEQNIIRVETDAGVFTCSKLVITAGSWSSQMLPFMKPKLQVTKQILAWINPKKISNFSLGNFPCWFIDDLEQGLFYGFPSLPNPEFDGPPGMKIAHHVRGELCDPCNVDQSVPAKAKENIDYLLKKYLPEFAQADITFKHCLYTYSEDSNFIIDHLPGYNHQVTIACGFSGHGFKFVSVVGEILADLITKGKTDLPIGFLSLRRINRQ